MSTRVLPDYCCPECGTMFRPRYVSSRYCSRKCSWANNGGNPRPASYPVESIPRGTNHSAWKGDAAAPNTKRNRARKAYALTVCERCGKPARDRHHKDDDTGNNVRENIALLCRRCHMAIDGRLEIFRALARKNHRAMRSGPKPCANCGRLWKPLRRGRCEACDAYWRRRGVERKVES
jgi:hypothetical protein